LDIDDLGHDPIAALRTWCDEALVCGMQAPTGMTLATVDADSRPDARIVLLKGIDDDGALLFFTNQDSVKGRQLAADPHAALVLWWDPLQRQVRVRGQVVQLDLPESDAYHASRPRGSQLGAWGSMQSRPVADRATLDAQFDAQEQRFGDGEIPRPPYWGGYRLIPGEIEFWQHQDERFHDRLLFMRDGDGWTVERLQP
jgi:pyridoxamine 5'-phosphate oxidase